MKKNFLLFDLTAFAALGTLASCEEEEEVWKDIYDTRLRIYRSGSYAPDYDYEFMYVEASENELKGQIFIDTNVFEPFTLKRIANPDWIVIKNWGFSKWFPKSN